MTRRIDCGDDMNGFRIGVKGTAKEIRFQLHTQLARQDEEVQYIVQPFVDCLVGLAYRHGRAVGLISGSMHGDYSGTVTISVTLPPLPEDLMTAPSTPGRNPNAPPTPPTPTGPTTPTPGTPPTSPAPSPTNPTPQPPGGGTPGGGGTTTPGTTGPNQ